MSDQNYAITELSLLVCAKGLTHEQLTAIDQYQIDGLEGGRSLMMILDFLISEEVNSGSPETDSLIMTPDHLFEASGFLKSFASTSSCQINLKNAVRNMALQMSSVSKGAGKSPVAVITNSLNVCDDYLPPSQRARLDSEYVIYCLPLYILCHWKDKATLVSRLSAIGSSDSASRSFNMWVRNTPVVKSLEVISGSSGIYTSVIPPRIDLTKATLNFSKQVRQMCAGRK